ncbi:glycogen debranching enzyme GlgX2 [Butyrivibrio proteoclasticus B316]|uniref:Glycogen debranching enzyme GlgX2 n=1 Tax=Butyrivibrio proteoclasticus (strain ATCC 51982 / DSM 14932 / B316) TaxID=515622 RepID=E0RWD3_BUTPB|nr:alpha-amylase family glycosyl hydrolase [Butyrivibrio proteoclasticus]ADL34231.1 glycogen debranching enzyme GlgX2 [Butyrivibrio proteoclasticus B316]
MSGKFEICNEKPYPLGCYIDYDKSLVVRAIFTDNKKCGITLYKSDGARIMDSLSISFSKSLKRGTIYSARIRGIKNIDEYDSYNYYADDAYFCDPYARHVIGLEKFGEDVPDNEIRAKLDNKSLQSHSASCFDWEGDVNPLVPYENSFVYLLNVRGYTKSSSSGVASARRGTFGGIIDKLSYLKELGVTTLELMPAYEMNEVENPVKKVSGKGNKVVYSKDGSLLNEKDISKKINFWGYKKGFYFAPRTSFCECPFDAENEFKNFIKILHKNGIEVIMQFYFDENENESLIIDALRFWRCTYHVDGFHLKGVRVPIRQIVKEPLFTDAKIWYDWFDTGDIYGTEAPNDRVLAIYNNSFMYATRRFLKSDDNTVNDFLKVMISNDNNNGIINYVCDYEGFRLADLVAYEHKHNEENGENNKDGIDNNLSWNCGIEGRTRKHNILELRKKQMKNIMTMLFMAQGTPMIFGGEEFGNSQAGNNNPYCQDNEIGWVDWKALDKNKDFYDYVRFLIDLRFSNDFLHNRRPFRLMDYISCGYPDMSCHGKEAWRPDLSGYSHVLGMLYCGLYEKSNDSDKPFIYVCYNMHWNRTEFALPKLPEGLRWSLLSDTGVYEGVKLSSQNSDFNILGDRSVRIYISETDPDYKKRKETGSKKNGKNRRN